MESEWTPLYKASSVLGPAFKEIFHGYRDNYAHSFAPREESKGGEVSAEYTTEQHEIHQRFAQECSDVLEKYVCSAGISTETLFAECQDCLDGKWCALFEEDVSQWFVDLCVNLQDFEWFANKIRTSAYDESKQ